MSEFNKFNEALKVALVLAALVVLVLIERALP